ncbi:acetyltransferase [Porphyromonas gulae]|uniref:GNAT family N-acetyltransferase n=1 Tax=Porphyromonas gulae TaxID=111105 RepID=UPI00052E20FC|nr:N-acetyltransferase [Porphyromonas gulae]KGO01865.1 acetyltransferase [Porphyromonas gulae]
MLRFSDLKSFSDADRSAVIRYVWELYTTSFPAEERRSYDNFLRTVLSDPSCSLFLIGERDVAEEAKGFIINWTLAPELSFIEHFAIAPEWRNRNIGQTAIEMMTALALSSDSCVLLEAEPPLTEIARRRIGFYERAGFEIIDTDYTQPPYEEDGRGVPLYLMAYNKGEIDAKSATKLLYGTVYNCPR